MHEGEYRLVSQYKSSSDPIRLLHLKCNTEYDVGRCKTFLTEGQGLCRKCYPPQVVTTRIASLTEQLFVVRLAEMDVVKSGEYEYIEGFQDYRSKTCVMYHRSCESTFLASPHGFTVKGNRCPTCSNANRGSHLRRKDYLQQLLAEREDGGDYVWQESYCGDNKAKHTIKHLTCSSVYKVRPNDFQQGYGCPFCNPPLPKEGGKRALLIGRILTELDVLFDREKTLPGCRLKNALKFDYFLPEYDLAIEFDGEQHFRNKSGSRISLEEVHKTIARDAAKNAYMQQTEEIGLLRIHYQLKEDGIRELLSALVEERLYADLIMKYDVMIKPVGKKHLLNEHGYYTRRNPRYFELRDQALNIIAVDKLP